MAFWLFRELGVETAVVETGLGGRLDATNVIAPAVTAITRDRLRSRGLPGAHLEAIAGEKAGILKAGVPAVFARQRPEAQVVLEARARELGLPVARAADFEVRDLHIDRAAGRSSAACVCPLGGGASGGQCDRRGAGFCASWASPPEGIAEARWPGRLECVSPNPDVILDGAHNPAGAAGFAALSRAILCGPQVWMVFGAMRDKSVEEIAEILFPLATGVILTGAGGSSRAFGRRR